MKIKEYSYLFEDLAILPAEIEILMGYESGKSPEPFPTLIQEALSEVSEHANIQGGIVVYNTMQLDSSDKTLVLGDVRFDVKPTVFKELSGSIKMAVFICTAGLIGEWSKELMSEGDLMKGYVVDVIGSVAVEKAMNKIHKAIEIEAKQAGLNITNRYSPGYCHWLVVEQQKLFSLLPPDFCGIRLSDSSLMYPVKSVSGVIGIGQNVTFNKYTCDNCDSVKCLYRNASVEKRDLG